MLRLSLVPGLGPTLIRRCLESLGSLSAVINASLGDLVAVEGIGPETATKVLAQIDSSQMDQSLVLEKQLIEEYGVSLYSQDDDQYPQLLRHIPDPPPLLFIKGQIVESDAVSLAVVGARRCTQYGREQAARLATLSSQAGLCVVSGGAYGIDAAAHRAVLAAGGRTIAIIGSGLARPYPREHTSLFDQIANGYGAVISELPMGYPVLAENFPRRNRIISGMSLGVLVIEASVRSGALITARICVEDHGRELMVLPGRVDSPSSAGCHKIIREGWATLITSGTDILDALGETGQLLRTGPSVPHIDSATNPRLLADVTESQRKIINVLQSPSALDQVLSMACLPVSVVQADLAMLEIRGLIRRVGNQFSVSL